MFAYAPFDITAGFGFRRVHEVEPKNAFLAVSLNVEAVAILALVFDEAAVFDNLPLVAKSRTAQQQDQGRNGKGFRAVAGSTLSAGIKNRQTDSSVLRLVGERGQ